MEFERPAEADNALGEGERFLKIQAMVCAVLFGGVDAAASSWLDPGAGHAGDLRRVSIETIAQHPGEADQHIVGRIVATMRDRYPEFREAA